MNLEGRIKAQFPGLIVTLLSVLIGLAFSDLVGIARAQMTLWPLDIAMLRTWSQIVAMGAVSLAVWIIFAHLGVSRLRIPAFADTVVVFILPLAIIVGNTLIGQKFIWPWFYYASFYLLISLGAWHWQVRIALAESELASFARLTRPLGPLSVIYFGIPSYAAAGWADSHGLLSPVAETLVAMSAGPAACLTAWIFVREWQRAISLARTN
ncbi:MAG: hypothetical protein JOY77_09270 [Alphaproteobacteria bacterium]|nr:hypothetical protein [Alphaproteobacteria bacterium]